MHFGYNILIDWVRRNFFQTSWRKNLSFFPQFPSDIIFTKSFDFIVCSVAGRNAQQFANTVLCAGVTAGFMAVVKANGRQFCSRPRLCGLL